MKKQNKKYGDPIVDTDSAYRIVMKDAMAERKRSMKLLGLLATLTGIILAVITVGMRSELNLAVYLVIALLLLILLILFVRAGVSRHPSVWLAEVVETDVLPNDAMNDRKHYLSASDARTGDMLIRIRMPDYTEYFLNPGRCHAEKGEDIYFYEFPGSRICGAVAKKDVEAAQKVL